MAQGVYVGDSNGIARKITNIYVGDQNGIARKIISAYIGDQNNIARKVYGDIKMPNKGDTILLKSNDGNLSYNGYFVRLLKVLNVNGTIAEVMYLYYLFNGSYQNDIGPMVFGSDYLYPTSNINTFFSDTFLSAGFIPENIQNVIVPKQIQQTEWYPIDSNDGTGYADPMNGRYWKNDGYASSQITAKCYIVGLEDIFDFLDTTTEMTYQNSTFTAPNIRKMFLPESLKDNSYIISNPPAEYIWTQSVNQMSNTQPFVIGNEGGLSWNSWTNAYVIYPTFQVDLSKIGWITEQDFAKSLS